MSKYENYNYVNLINATINNFDNIWKVLKNKGKLLTENQKNEIDLVDVDRYSTYINSLVSMYKQDGDSEEIFNPSTINLHTIRYFDPSENATRIGFNPDQNVITFANDEYNFSFNILTAGYYPLGKKLNIPLQATRVEFTSNYKKEIEIITGSDGSKEDLKYYYVKPKENELFGEIRVNPSILSISGSGKVDSLNTEIKTTISQKADKLDFDVWDNITHKEEDYYKISIKSEANVNGVASSQGTISLSTGFIEETGEIEIGDHEGFDSVDIKDYKSLTSDFSIPKGKVTGGDLYISVGNENTYKYKETYNETTDYSHFAHILDPEDKDNNKFVKVTTEAKTITVKEGYIDGESSNMSSYTPNNLTIKIPAIKSANITLSAPSSSVSVIKATTFNSQNGMVEGSLIGENKTITSNEYSFTFDESIDSVNTIVSTTEGDDAVKINNKYIINEITANTQKGSTTVEVGKDTTGEDVDKYISNLYKRLLGRQIDILPEMNKN